MNSVCSTAAICLHLHPFPVVWHMHSHVGLGGGPLRRRTIRNKEFLGQPRRIKP